MAAILASLGFTFLIDRMTEVLTPDIYIELTALPPQRSHKVAARGALSKPSIRSG